jgi:alpha-L-arabinofuranosidase
MKRFIRWCLAFGCVIPGLHAQTPAAVYRILPEAMNERPVNPLIYGNFIELGLGRQIEGLWAEKLYNASFEEVPPLKENLYGWLGKSAEYDLTQEKWWHTGYETCDWYCLPETDEIKYGNNRYWNFHHGLQSAVLENRQRSGRAYLAQDGIHINPGERYLFRGYFSNNRTADVTPGPVAVTIGLYPEKQTDKPLVEKTITVPNGVFREIPVELDPGAYQGRATFAVSIGPGTVAAMDGFSLMPLNAVRGWRLDAVKALKQIHVPMIRFPGGCFASFYDWREGVGPRLDRQPVESEYWGGIEENHAGTVEFVELCRMIGSEPFLCVNMLTGTADQAAGWVEYCNGSQESGMGKLRKLHGYPEPLNVRYWELDNETYRRFGWEEYARKCVEYSIAMKAVDPDVKLVMIGYWKFNDNLTDMLEIAGKYIDVITDRATAEPNLLRDLKIIRDYNRTHGTHITLSNTEWLTPLDWSKTSLDALNLQQSPDGMSLQEHEISWNYAMNTARQLLLFQRLGGDLEFTSFNNLGNTWGQNIIECPKDTVFISAAGRIFELMSRSPLRYVMKTDTIRNLPGVIIQAGTSHLSGVGPNAGVRKLVVYILNYRSDRPDIRLNLKDFPIAPQAAAVRSVNASGPLSENTVRDPEQVRKTEWNIDINKPERSTIRVMPWSVTEITITLHP